MVSLVSQYIMEIRLILGILMCIVLSQHVLQYSSVLRSHMALPRQTYLFKLVQPQ